MLGERREFTGELVEEEDRAPRRTSAGRHHPCRYPCGTVFQVVDSTLHPPPRRSGSVTRSGVFSSGRERGGRPSGPGSNPGTPTDPGPGTRGEGSCADTTVYRNPRAPRVKRLETKFPRPGAPGETSRTPFRVPGPQTWAPSLALFVHALRARQSLGPFRRSRTPNTVPHTQNGKSPPSTELRGAREFRHQD